MESIGKEIGMLFGAIIIGIVIEGIKQITSWYKNRKKNKKENFVYQAQKDLYIDEILFETRSFYEADSVAVYQLHNGTNYKSQDPIKFMSMSHVTTIPAFRNYMEESQYMRVYEFNKTFLKTVDQKVFQCDPNTAEDYYIQQKLSVRGLKGMIWVIIEGPDEKPLGVLSLYFSKELPKINSGEYKALISKAKSIGYKLNE